MDAEFELRFSVGEWGTVRGDSAGKLGRSALNVSTLQIGVPLPVIGISGHQNMRHSGLSWLSWFQQDSHLSEILNSNS